jgi:hypothetical protein
MRSIPAKRDRATFLKPHSSSLMNFCNYSEELHPRREKPCPL